MNPRVFREVPILTPLQVHRLSQRHFLLVRILNRTASFSECSLIRSDVSIAKGIKHPPFGPSSAARTHRGPLLPSWQVTRFAADLYCIVFPPCRLCGATPMC